MMDVRSMEVEATISQFIEFFVKFTKRMSQQPDAPTIGDADIEQVAMTLEAVKTYFVAQISVREMLRASGVDLGGMEGSGA